LGEAIVPRIAELFHVTPQQQQSQRKIFISA